MFGSKDLLFSAETYRVAKSLRFRSSATAYLNRTPGTATDNKKWTYSCWLKRGSLGGSAYTPILDGYFNASNWTTIFFISDQLYFYNFVAGVDTSVDTAAVLRDPSAWYHIVFVFDSANATAANRGIFYVNGVKQTVNNTYGAITLNEQSFWNQNSSSVNYIGRRTDGGLYADGYLAEVNFIDGQALDPTYFGSYDTNGIWQPKGYTGTYGTNGFYLKFTDVGATSGANSGYGKDFSGFNTNYWTTNNFGTTSTATTYDSMYDSPVNASNGITGIGNYCVLNPINAGMGTTIIDGNLTFTGVANTNEGYVLSTMGVDTGSFYFEVQPSSFTGILEVYISNRLGITAGYRSDGTKDVDGVNSAYGASWTASNIIGCAFNAGTKTVTFYKDNASQGSFTYTGSGLVYAGVVVRGAGSANGSVNFGQRPYAYTPPSGFSALNTQNLSTPTITNGASYMAATTYTGNGSTQNITNGGNNSAGTTFQPDFVWIKGRSTASDNGLSDVLRNASGLMYVLYSNSTSAESLGGAYVYYPTLSNGFTVTNNAGANQNLSTYVAWQWNAGGAPTTDNVAGAGNIPTAGSVKINGSNSTSTLAGSIAATRLSANTSAGFSVVTYTGTGANATVGHGLGVAPSMIIVKDRDLGTAGWCVFHTSSGAGNYLLLNGTAANTASTVVWNNTAPDSSKFALGAFVGSNANGDRHVAYCFAPVAGYSAFGSYTGNGSTDGPFVYTGFRPRWILWKRSDGTPQDWFILDTSRDTYNQASLRLCPDLTNAEASSSAAYSDILSNGFKVRSTDNATNASGGTYIYAAFAENPFRIARAR